MTLPNFLHVGAAKTGTTSLYHYLRQHPDVFMSPKKGPEFFVSRFRNGFGKGPGDGSKPVVSDFQTYEALFDGAGDARIVGESSVGYLYHHEEAIPLISEYLGEPRILITLRNPVDLAYSCYMHIRRQKRETLSFEQGLEAEEQRFREGWHYQWLYRRVGLFASQVAAYQEHFSHVKVALSEDLKQDPAQYMEELYAFLGVDAGFRPDTSVNYNEGGIPRHDMLFRLLIGNTKTRPKSVKLLGRFMNEDRLLRRREKLKSRMISKEPMDPSTRRTLLDSYREDIHRLEKLIGRDLSAWLEPS